MGMLSFFPRQVVAGDEGAPASIYSEVFEVTDYAQIVAEVRVYSANPSVAAIAVDFEESSDPTFSTWGHSKC